MTNAKWLIALDMANVLMGNVFVPEDTQDHPASKVRKGPSINFYKEENCKMIFPLKSLPVHVSRRSVMSVPPNVMEPEIVSKQNNSPLPLDAT